MNYMKEVAALLGVQLNEEFKIIDEYGDELLNSYKLTDKGLLKHNEQLAIDVLESILIGMYQIQKLPFKPKSGDTYWTFSFTLEGNIKTRMLKWTDWVDDYLAYYNNLCFRTEEEAEQNKDKLLKIINHYEED